jgi:hypothetical protein
MKKKGRKARYPPNKALEVREVSFLDVVAGWDLQRLLVQLRSARMAVQPLSSKRIGVRSESETWRQRRTIPFLPFVLRAREYPPLNRVERWGKIQGQSRRTRTRVVLKSVKQM